MIVIALANERNYKTPSINTESIWKVEHSFVFDLQSITSQQNRRSIYEKLTPNVIFDGILLSKDDDQDVVVHPHLFFSVVYQWF